MIVASLHSLEHRLMQSQLRLRAVFDERNRGQELMARGAVRAFPGECEDNALRFDDFPIDPGFPMLGAVRRAHAEAECTTNADVHVAVNGGESLRPPPSC